MNPDAFVKSPTDPGGSRRIPPFGASFLQATRLMDNPFWTPQDLIGMLAHRVDRHQQVRPIKHIVDFFVESDVSRGKTESEAGSWDPKQPDKTIRWCRRRDLNPHGFPHTPLKRACLPFHHFGTIRKIRRNRDRSPFRDSRERSAF